MADIVSSEKRSQMMAGIKGKDTKPELVVRKALHKLGFRYSLHSKTLPGKPDLVFRKYNAVIFVHGCFWHQHNCILFKWPSSRREFWRAKLERNVQVDTKALAALLQSGKRVAIIWECALKGKKKLPFEEMIRTVSDWLLSEKQYLDLKAPE